MTVLCTPAVEDFLNIIYTDESVAYVGRRFSNAFLEWNYAFCSDIRDAIYSRAVTYIGTTCTLVIDYGISSTNALIVNILKCNINMRLLRNVEKESNFERVDNGLPSLPPSTLSSPPLVDFSKSPTLPMSKVKPFAIHSGATLSDETYYNGMKVAYYDNMYAILNADGTPFVSKWFKSKPRIWMKPFGKYNIIAHVNYFGSLFAVDINGRMYDMNRLWKDAYLEHYINYNAIISESINNLVREIIEEDRQRRIQRIVRETIERFINNLVA